MSFIITEHTRQTIARSMADVSQHQSQLAEAMSRSLEGSGRMVAEVEHSAGMLVDLMISQAHSLASKGKWLGLDHEQAALIEQKIGAREFTPFGDRLAEVLPSVVPACREPMVTSAWCDVFWTIVLSLPRSDHGRNARAPSQPEASA